MVNVVDTISHNEERTIFIDTQDRVMETKNGITREIRDLEERQEVLRNTEWEFLVDLLF